MCQVITNRHGAVVGQLIGPALTVEGFADKKVAVCIAREVQIQVCWLKYSVPDFVSGDGSGGYSDPLLVNTSSSLTHQVSFVTGEAGGASTASQVRVASTSGSLSEGQLVTSQADDFYKGWSVKIFDSNSNSGTYETRTVTSYDGASRTATLDSALTTSAAGRYYEMRAVGFTSLGQQICGEVHVGPTGSLTLYPILRGALRHDPANNGSYTRDVLPYVAYAGKAVCAELNFSRIHISYSEYYARKAAEAAAMAASIRAEMAAAGWGGSGACCRVNSSQVLTALDLDALHLCNCRDELSLLPLQAHEGAVVVHLPGSGLTQRNPDQLWWRTVLQTSQANVWDLAALLADWDRGSYGRNATLCNYTMWNFSAWQGLHSCNITWSFSDPPTQSSLRADAASRAFPGATGQSWLARHGRGMGRGKELRRRSGEERPRAATAAAAPLKQAIAARWSLLSRLSASPPASQDSQENEFLLPYGSREKGSRRLLSHDCRYPVFSMLLVPCVWCGEMRRHAFSHRESIWNNFHTYRCLASEGTTE